MDTGSMLLLAFLVLSAMVALVFLGIAAATYPELRAAMRDLGIAATAIGAGMLLLAFAPLLLALALWVALARTYRTRRTFR